MVHMPDQDGSQALIVIQIHPGGLIHRWNEEQRANGQLEQQVRIGDRIVGVVDDIDGDAKDIDAMRRLMKKDTVEFIIERLPPSADTVD